MYLTKNGLGAELDIDNKILVDSQHRQLSADNQTNHHTTIINQQQWATATKTMNNRRPTATHDNYQSSSTRGGRPIS